MLSRFVGAVRRVTLIVLLFPLALATTPLSATGTVHRTGVDCRVISLTSNAAIGDCGPRRYTVPTSVAGLVAATATVSLLNNGFHFRARLRAGNRVRTSRLANSLVVGNNYSPALNSGRVNSPSFVSHVTSTVRRGNVQRVENSVHDSTSVVTPFPIPLN